MLLFLPQAMASAQSHAALARAGAEVWAHSVPWLRSGARGGGRASRKLAKGNVIGRGKAVVWNSVSTNLSHTFHSCLRATPCVPSLRRHGETPGGNPSLARRPAQPGRRNAGAHARQGGTAGTAASRWREEVRCAYAGIFAKTRENAWHFVWRGAGARLPLKSLGEHWFVCAPQSVLQATITV